MLKSGSKEYTSVHQWVIRRKGLPQKCEHCWTESRRCHWANVSGEYKRDLNDYIRLCVPCHKVFDGEVGQRDFCQKGHEMTPDNVYVAPKYGYRSCIICRRIGKRKWYLGAKKRELFGYKNGGWRNAGRWAQEGLER